MSRKAKQPTRPALSQGDEEFLILCASRYCKGRSTGAPWLFVHFMEERLCYLSEGCLCGILRDIQEAEPDGLGDDLNTVEWMTLKMQIEERLKCIHRQQLLNKGKK